MKDIPYKETIHAQGKEIALLSDGKQRDYISLTDIAKYRSDEPNDVIRNWLRNRDTLDFLGLWETLNNPSFNTTAWENILRESGRNAFTLSPSKIDNLLYELRKKNLIYPTHRGKGGVWILQK